MKWYNEDRTTMVDTTTVNYYHFDIHNQILTLVINGHPTLLAGEEAKDLYVELSGLGAKQLLNESD